MWRVLPFQACIWVNLGHYLDFHLPYKFGASNTINHNWFCDRTCIDNSETSVCYLSLNMMPLQQCAPLRWHYSAINSITFDLFDRIIRCIHSSRIPDLLMYPLTFRMPLTSINGARKHSALAILKLLSFYFSLPSSSLKCLKKIDNAITCFLWKFYI